jgi:hypothetical protein
MHWCMPLCTCIIPDHTIAWTPRYSMVMHLGLPCAERVSLACIASALILLQDVAVTAKNRWLNQHSCVSLQSQLTCWPA